MRRLFILVLMLQLGYSATCFSQTFTSSIAIEDFGNCIASQVNKNGGRTYLETRQKLASENRKTLLQNSPKTLKPLEKMNLIGNTISVEAALASLPLIDFSKLSNEGKTKLSKANMLFMKYCKNTVCKDNNLVSKKDWPDIVKKSDEALKNYNLNLSADQYSLRLNQVLYSANPIVDWLLQQQEGSVNHWQLLKFATDIFDGDILTALGVVGELFKQETSYCKDRNKEAVLASKMKKIVPEDEKYPFGINYHFWQLISASLIRNGTTLGKIYGFLDNSEPAYKYGNKVASKVTDVILASIGSKDKKCYLSHSIEKSVPVRSITPSSGVDGVR